MHRWIIQREWKLIQPATKADPPELYNLTTDPHEKENLAAAQPETVKSLTDLLKVGVPPSGGP
jgi:arylsulfatase A-like enzyme